MGDDAAGRTSGSEKTKRELIEELLLDPATRPRSNTAIAAMCGSSPTHVSKTRFMLEVAGVIPVLDEFVREDGVVVARARVASQRRTERDRLQRHASTRRERDPPDARPQPVDPPARVTAPGRQGAGDEPGATLVGRCDGVADLASVRAQLARIGRLERVVVLWDGGVPLPLSTLAELTDALADLGLALTPLAHALHACDIALCWERA